jgi:hypothetical protein
VRYKAEAMDMYWTEEEIEWKGIHWKLI